LFPFQKSIDNGIKHLKHLKEITVFENVAHGVETHKEAMQYIGNKIRQHQNGEIDHAQHQSTII